MASHAHAKKKKKTLIWTASIEDIVEEKGPNYIMQSCHFNNCITTVLDVQFLTSTST